jgi:hypothetical protein
MPRNFNNLKPVVLQNLPENTLKNLCTLYKVSIALGYTPKRWTDSKVIFIAKTGKDSYDNANSFRPISLCSFLLKGLERLILFHLEETNLTRKPLCKAQHAFRRGKGTETALSEAVDKIESGILTKKYALGVFLDISGAFNSLFFNAATNAMRRRGFPEHITKWYEHFLHHQVSTFELDGKFYIRKLKTGCPQGGCLSPLIWNAYVNFDSILKKLNKGPVKVIGFADDALFIITGHVPGVMVRRMQPYINKIVAWGKRSGLEFNSSKTMAVLFTRKMLKDSDYLEKIIINDEQIDFSDEAKYLGVVLDSKLTWNSHIKAKVIKAKRLLFAIKNSIAKTVGPKPSIVGNAFKTLVVPMVSYACHLFADKLNNITPQKELSRLNRIACLSLGSVPPSTPTATMGILFN